MKILSLVGARPQFIKAAAVSRRLQEMNEESGRDRVDEVLVHTGQHYDENMSRVFFEELEIREADYNLGVGSAPHGAQTGRMLERIEAVLQKERPDFVVVYGDTNSTLAGALAAVKLHIPVGHVEAGLRSFNRRMPEEINRVVADHVSDILFCPTEKAVENLAREGISKGVHRVGDVMYDCALYYGKRAESRRDLLARLKLSPQRYALATVHRAENTDDSQRLRSIFRGLSRVAERGLPVVIPLHPRTRARISGLGMELKEAVRLLTPVSYIDMIALERNAKVIVTDSGGVQKEAYFYRVPCVTLRDETEWTETVESGWNVLAGAEADRIADAVTNACRPSGWENHYGDGDAAGHILDILLSRGKSPGAPTNPKGAEMKDIEQAISRLAEQTGVLIARPEDIQKLVEQGVLTRKAPQRTLEESIEVLFERRKKAALEIARRFPGPLPSGHPSIESLYAEIRNCVLFGLNGAAITLCGILVEYVLKYAAYTREVGGHQKYDAKLWDAYENKTFGPAIDAAAEAGLLTEDLIRRLRSFKDTVRNPYSHYNIKKITEHVVAKGVKILKLDTREIHGRDIPAVESPVIQAQAKPWFDGGLVWGVVSFADTVVRHLLDQIEA